MNQLFTYRHTLICTNGPQGNARKVTEPPSKTTAVIMNKHFLYFQVGTTKQNTAQNPANTTLSDVFACVEYAFIKQCLPVVVTTERRHNSEIILAGLYQLSRVPLWSPSRFVFSCRAPMLLGGGAGQQM